MLKKIIYGIVIVVLGLGVWRYWAGSNPRPRPEKASQAEAPADKTDLQQKVLSFSIDGRSPKGVKQWHLEGSSAELKEDDIHLNDLAAVAYGDDVTVNLTSDKGVYSRDKAEAVSYTHLTLPTN